MVSTVSTARDHQGCNECDDRATLQPPTHAAFIRSFKFLCSQVDWTIINFIAKHPLYKIIN